MQYKIRHTVCESFVQHILVLKRLSGYQLVILIIINILTEVWELKYYVTITVK